jgi:hypothetical protein
VSRKPSICIGIVLVVLAVAGPADSWAMSVQEADAIIKRAYNDCLGRDPDAAGLKNYRHLLIDKDWSEKHVREDIQESSEAEGRDAGQVVKRAYRAVLGRDPDPEGLKMYARKVEKDGWSQGDVEDVLRKSDEYRRVGADAIIQRAYRDLLGRDPDKGGLENYRKLIVDKGWSEDDVRHDLKKSPEYKNRNR